MIHFSVQLSFLLCLFVLVFNNIYILKTLQNVFIVSDLESTDDTKIEHLSNSLDDNAEILDLI